MLRNLLALACLLAIASFASAGGLEVYLPLDCDVNDYSGNGNHGVLVDGAAGTNCYIAGVNGQGLDFGLTAGDNKANAEATKTNADYVAVNYTLTEAGTIAMWYKKAEFDYNYEAVWDNSGVSAVPQDSWECWIDNWGPGDLYCRAPDGDTQWDPVKISLGEKYGAGQYQDEWMHIAVSWAKTSATEMEMKMYLNGELGSAKTNMIWQDAGDTFYLAGGHDGNTQGIGGYDEVAIWSCQLSDAEIQDVFVNGVPEPSTLALLLLGGATILLRRRGR